MSTDWIPFGKPIRYHYQRTVYDDRTGWIIAWRAHWSNDKAHACDAMEYLTSDCSIIQVDYGDKNDKLEFLA